MDIIYDHQGMLLTDADFKGISVGLDQFWDGRQIELFVIYSVLIHLLVFFQVKGQKPSHTFQACSKIFKVDPVRVENYTGLFSKHGNFLI